MAVMTAEIYSPFLAALLAGLEYERQYAQWVARGKDARLRLPVDQEKKVYLRHLRSLRFFSDHWADQLEHTIQRLFWVDLGTHDDWLERQALALGVPGQEYTAQRIASYITVESRRATVLRRLGDDEGAEVAERQAAGVAATTRDRRVISDPRAEKQARADERARRLAQQERERAQRQKPAAPAVEQEQLDYAA